MWRCNGARSGSVPDRPILHWRQRKRLHAAKIALLRPPIMQCSCGECDLCANSNKIKAAAAYNAVLLPLWKN
ncbi:hypothetical protein NDU88_000607 [Pleurodeles waltl]|uniref:Uncharacterized protein n=1 Tax=Pleurodeles waltl TaxID=8319 RepID=A0AAV7S8K9_PLEWA|nr:hypothetical protein NDU88_000607 [Pleurodeles waltl]